MLVDCFQKIIHVARWRAMAQKHVAANPQRRREALQPCIMLRQQVLHRMPVRLAQLSFWKRQQLPLVIAPNGWDRHVNQPLRRFARLQRTRHHIAKIDRQVSSAIFNVRQHRFQRGKVPVHIGYDRDPHRPMVPTSLIAKTF